MFRSAGFEHTATFTSLFNEAHPAPLQAVYDLVGEKNERWIGIAPFAKHQGKIYPIDEMEKVVEYLSAQPNLRIFLFGGGEYETAILGQWEYQFPHTKSIVGKYSLDL